MATSDTGKPTTIQSRAHQPIHCFLPAIVEYQLKELVGSLLALQMALCLYVGNAIKDLVCAPRPLNVAYGKEKLKFLGANYTEVLINSKVGQLGGSVCKAAQHLRTSCWTGAPFGCQMRWRCTIAICAL